MLINIKHKIGKHYSCNFCIYIYIYIYIFFIQGVPLVLTVKGDSQGLGVSKPGLEISSKRQN